MVSEDPLTLADDRYWTHFRSKICKEYSKCDRRIRSDIAVQGDFFKGLPAKFELGTVFGLLQT